MPQLEQALKRGEPAGATCRFGMGVEASRHTEELSDDRHAPLERDGRGGGRRARHRRSQRQRRVSAKEPPQLTPTPRLFLSSVSFHFFYLSLSLLPSPSAPGSLSPLPPCFSLPLLFSSPPNLLLPRCRLRWSPLLWPALGTAH